MSCRSIWVLIWFLLFATSFFSSTQASTSGVVISQVYGDNGGTYQHDYVELFNAGTSAVSINGWSVQVAALSLTNWQKTDLPNVMLQAGQYYLIQLGGSTGGASLPNPDLTGTAGVHSGSGKVVLLSDQTLLTESDPYASGAVVDFVGYGSTDYNEGSGAAPSPNTFALLRLNSGCTDTDDNASDFTTGSPTPRSTSSATHSCGGSGGDNPPTVTSTTPTDGATDVAISANIVIDFSEPVDVTGSWFSIVCGGSPINAAVSGSGQIRTLDPTTDFPHSATCTVTIVASQVSDTDGTADPMGSDYTWQFTTIADNDVPPSVVTTIPDADALDVAVESDITVNFSEPVTVTAPWFSLTCGGSSVTAAVSSANGGQTQIINPDNNLPNGTGCTVTITASQVEDQDGTPHAMTATYSWNFTTVAAVDNPPAVSGVTPASGATNIPANQNLSVTFSEAVTASGNWFTVVCTSGSVIATVSGGPMTYILDPLTDFTHSDSCTVTIIKSNVTDRDGSADSMASDFTWNFTLVPIGGDVPPFVTSTSPVNGASGVLLDAQFAVSFSEDVLASTNWFTINCSISGNVAAVAAGGPQNFTLDPNSSFAAGETCIVWIHAAQVNDLDGTFQDMAADYLWSFVTVGGGDGDTPPAVTSHAPAANAADVQVNSNININFSENVHATSDSFDVTCSLSGAHAAGLNGGPQNFTLNPVTDFANGETCTVTVKAAWVFDLDGASTYMLADYSWNFTTLDIPPTVTGTTPSSSAVNVPVNANIAVNFSENVSISLNSFTISCAKSGAVTFTLSGGGSTHILDPIADLMYVDTCTVTVIAAQVSDTDGPPVYNLPGNYVWSFTTAANQGDTPPTVQSVTPANGATNVPVSSSITVNFSEDVTRLSGWFTIDCNGIVDATASGGPQSFTLDPASNLPHDTICNVTIHAAKVKDLDFDVQDSMAADFVWSFTTEPETPAITPPSISSVTPANGALGVPLDTNITITFREDVAVSGTWFTISCTTSSTVTAAIIGGPQTFTLNPNADFANGETCTVTILASQVHDLDDTPHNLPSNYMWSFTTAPPVGVCDDSFTATYTIQGSGDISSLLGSIVVTQGIVTADFEGITPDTLGGFYVQAEFSDQDPLTSDGLFVYNPGVDVVTSGLVVRVTGMVDETHGQTRLVAPVTVIGCGRTAEIAPTPVTLPFASAAQPEQFEGMLVAFSQELTVSDHHDLGRFGELTLSAGGRLWQPTNVAAPGAAANAQAAANALNQIGLDDNRTTQNPDPTPYLSDSGTRRVGDTITNLTGVLSYNFGTYRIQPTVDVQFNSANPRTAAPENLGGMLRVASFNVLNYFNGPDFPTARGADTEAEFVRQREKIIAAMVALNADIIGLIEIENDGYDESSAIQDLVNGLNAATAPGTYAFIAPDFPLGSDLVKVALLYRPETVTPIGAPARTIQAPFNRRRPPLAQTFRENATNEVVTVVVNHFKAKICDNAAGADSDQGDGQGCWNAERTQAAHTLTSWLAADPTQSHDPDFLIIGDLNAYALEDPITAIQNAGYTNLIALYQGTGGYSYNFEGQSGYLDHALASHTLTPQVGGATIWHINADEPPVLDYNVENKSPAQQALNTGTPYRSSDHDPVVVNLRLGEGNGYAGDLKLLEPSGVINMGYGNPLFKWSRPEGAAEYQIYLANTAALSSPVFYDIVTGNCHTDATCSLDLTTLSEAYRLVDGSYIVYMRAWHDQTPGAWTGPFTFTLDAPAPNAVTLQPVAALNQSRPVFHWTLDDTAAYAVWFRVYVAPMHDLAAPQIHDWFSRAALCGVDGTTCTLPSPVDMANGTYGLYVQSWGPGGFSVGGIQNTGFAGMDFTISGTIPQTPNGLTVTKNQGRPTVMWADDTNTSWYEVRIDHAGGEPFYDNWYYRTPDWCSGLVCTLTPDIHPQNGSYVILVRGWSPVGFGQWSFPVNLVLDFPPPAPPVPLTVTNPHGGQPTFTWQGVPAATWYQLWIGSATLETHHTGWYMAADLGCAEPGICAATPILALPNDSYIWYVQAWGPGGLSRNVADGWAAGPAFIVSAPPAGTPAPITPDSTTNKHNPVFMWYHLDGVVYYEFWLERLENFAPMETVRDVWFSAVSLGCVSGTCTLHIPDLNLANGDYAWALRAYTPHGIGGWSVKQTFTVNR